jgi:hypothetical protein
VGNAAEMQGSTENQGKLKIVFHISQQKSVEKYGLFLCTMLLILIKLLNILLNIETK